MNEETVPEESSRLKEFQSQVDDLKLSGGRANPERLAVRFALALFAAAIAIEIIAYNSSFNADDPQAQTDFVILAILGVVVALGAVGLFVLASLTRYFRYWLVRLVYEDRANTDRIIEAMATTKDHN